MSVGVGAAGRTGEGETEWLRLSTVSIEVVGGVAPTSYGAGAAAGAVAAALSRGEGTAEASFESFGTTRDCLPCIGVEAAQPMSAQRRHAAHVTQQ